MTDTIANHTVLVVDDKPLMRLVLRDALEDAGFNVLEAPNGREAFEVLMSQNIEVIVADMDDGDDGLELVSLEQGVYGVGDRFIARPYSPEHVAEAVCDIIYRP